ncbi:MAG: TonB-dependent receptor, partial [Sphingomonadaceae bacterium]|nr:TonB-dependent receptor [Sphingomonadaceae bacterium]
TVLATGFEIPVDKAGQSLSIVGPEEIASIQGADLTRVLERLPGVTFTRNGGLGGFTGLFVRGANSQQLLVLVDGIRVADAAAPSGGYDFGNLMTGPIGKVELLRGSNSVVWGSAAIGGILAMTSRSVEGVEAGVEYGARDTANADVSGGYSNGSSAISLAAGYTQTDGFSSAAAGTETDGFRQYRVSGRGRAEMGHGLSLVAAGRYADSRLEFDSFSFSPPYGLIDTPDFSETAEVSGRAGLAYDGGALDLEAAYALYDIDRANFNPDFGREPGFASKGRQERVAVKGTWDAGQGLRFNFGADHEWSRFETNFDGRNTAELSSAHALVSWQGGIVIVAAGARIDDHSRFGSDATFGANGTVDLGGEWRVRASYGEGFKVPTLYQLYSDFGNGALSPERSKSYDISIEKGDRSAAVHIALTAFRRDTRGLIDFISCFSVSDPLCDDGRFGFYQNVGKARAEGIELEMGARITDHFRAQAAYSYVRAKDRTPGGFNSGNDLARRPGHAVTVAVDWTSPLAGLALGGDIRMVSGSFDDAGNVSRLDGYALGTLRVSLPVNDRIVLFGRIENVTDEHYQTAAGYGTAGRSATIGARARF